jgi:hypothetical protein
MSNTIFRVVLWIHTVVAGIAGLYFYLAPLSAALLWPWPLPALAARFVGSLLVGGAVCTALTALNRTNIAAAGITFLGIGDGLIALTGLLYGAASGISAQLGLWLLVLAGAALILVVFSIRVSPRLSEVTPPMPGSRLVRGYFTLHLIVVALVGSVMFLLPVQAQPLWPWTMSPVNVRLIGAFFVGAALYSLWGRRQKTWETIRPTMALYATFATSALVASFIHFNLFNPARVTTWVFVALYAFVGAGGCYFLWRVNSSFGRIDSRRAFS